MVRGELVVGHRGAAGEIDFALDDSGEPSDDPCAAAISAFTSETVAGASASGEKTLLAEPFGVPAIFAAARAGDQLAGLAVSETARRIAVHILPIAAVADVELIVLGGGIGVNGDLLLGPIRQRLAKQLPFPPSVEVSTLGDAAVLTGALSIGLDVALEHAFNERS
jgi:predicted NBD/HSP70 family sugar kinase